MDGLQVITTPDGWDKREAAMPLPDREQGYTRILLLGATGAGKSTLVRYLIGTDPRTERFPATSTAKTTIADTEVVVVPEAREFEAIATFMSRADARKALEENVVAAVRAKLRGKEPIDIIERLLDHVSQRYRFSYVLGQARALAEAGGVADPVDEDDDDTPGADDDEVDDGPPPPVDQFTVQLMQRLLNTVDEISRMNAWGDVDDARIRKHPKFSGAVDSLMTDVLRRIDWTTKGTMKRDPSGWPLSWQYADSDRQAFFAGLANVASNMSSRFGFLLTPLVDGLRIRGPFSPHWSRTGDRIVLLDGEGLGHRAGSDDLSDKMIQLLDLSDAVLMVDNAAQPMQQTSAHALQAIEARGHSSKLHYVFTHFDLVRGVNLRGRDDRERHVLASAENVLHAIDNKSGHDASRKLQRRLDTSRYFFRLRDGGAGRATVRVLRDMLDAARREPVDESTICCPIYDFTSLVDDCYVVAEVYHHGGPGGHRGDAGRMQHELWVALNENPTWTQEPGDRKDEILGSLAEQLSAAFVGLPTGPRMSVDGGPGEDFALLTGVEATVEQFAEKRLLELTVPQMP